MDEDPGFVFSCSSAQQLAWIKELYPELFGRIREKVKTGQFVPVGGMWVESDTNMPGGEAMARQFLEGKSFFLAEFGVECEEAWLPDTFGYSAAMPQIVKAAGSKWFLTQKISWNQVNRMPHHTFNWEGIDGTRVFTHFPPVDSYSSELSGRELAHAERNYRDHGRGTVSLVPFGYGDGGGGPTREMLAAARRTADLEGSPKVELGSAASFFARAQAEYEALPVWVGEMYLELHRGTYTSQAKTKLGNRRSEHLLREAELWCATAAVRAGYVYPAAELKRLWRLVLLQQFHDILPGSSIAWVHQDAERNYAAVGRQLEAIIADAAGAVLGAGDTDFLLNAAPHERHGVPALAAAEPVPAGQPVLVTEAGGGYILDNGIIRAVINADGLLESLIDYASGRDAIAPGQFGNLLELHRDTPNEWDAWDIDAFYRRNVVRLTGARSLTVESRWPGRRRRGGTAGGVLGGHPADLAGGRAPAPWRFRRRLTGRKAKSCSSSDSRSTSGRTARRRRPSSGMCSARRTSTPPGKRRSSRSAPTGGSTSPSPATAWRCPTHPRYGHDVTRNIREDDGGTTTTVRLSLLRAPKFPDPARGPRPARTERHHPARAPASPTPSRRGTARIWRRAWSRAPTAWSRSLTVSNPALVIEAVKLAEDGSGDVIVRVYESLGERSAGLVTAGFAVSGVHAVDLLERPAAAPGVTPAGDAAELALRPFQLVTLRFVR